MANNSNKKLVPEAMTALDKFKYEVASEVGVNLKDGYNGDISAKDAGKVSTNVLISLFLGRKLNFVFMKYIKAGFDFLPLIFYFNLSFWFY